jgi:recombination protein RecT
MDLLEGDEFKLAVAKALPKHLTPDRFVRVACTAMMRTPKLAQCDQTSFFNCLLTLSQFGLEPDGRHAHLIPFENRKRGVTECQLIIDYKGLVDLAMRSAILSNIHADVICDNDEFEYNLGKITQHKIDFRKPRGPAYAVYAIARFKDGSEKCEVMTMDDIAAIRARSRAKDSGPWVTDYNEMAKKTVFRRLSKWIPISAEFRDAIDHDADQLEDKRFEAAKPVFSPTAPVLFQGEPQQALPDAQNGTVEPSEPQPSVNTADAQAESPAGDVGPQDELGRLIVGSGYTWDQFAAWVRELGIVDLSDVNSFGEMSAASAERLLKSKAGMLEQLAAFTKG